MSHFEDILSKFENRRKSGSGFTARCPAHNDNKNSLSVKEGDDGKTVLFCHAGCTPEAICLGTGIQVKDLFRTAPTTGTPRSKGT
jgi:putative DNA primase/helicase